MQTLNSTPSSNPTNKLARFAVPLFAPVIIALVALLIVFYMVNAATVTPPDGDEATLIMLQRRCAMPVQMMTTEIHHPYTGERVSLTRAHCAMPKEPAVINTGD